MAAATAQEDQTNAWRSGWFAVAPLADLAGDGDHLTIALPTLSLTFQNFRGALRGFWNVCSHRTALMRPCGRGRGLLRCPYHGWTYNADGVPVGVPENETLFGLSRDDKRRLALRAVKVERAGPLVFARVADAHATLRDALGSAAVVLDALADGTPVASRETVVAQPWESVCAGLRASPVAGARYFVPPNLVIDCAGGWALTRSVLPDSAERSTATAILWPRPGTDEPTPAKLQHLFDGAGA